MADTALDDTTEPNKAQHAQRSQGYAAPDMRFLKGHIPILYVVAPDLHGPCKVGVTENLYRRMPDLQVGCWERLRPYAIRAALPRNVEYNFHWKPKPALLQGAYGLERVVHKKAKELELNLEGEWLDVSAKDAVALIDKCGKLNNIAPLSLEAMAEFDDQWIDREARKLRIVIERGLLKATAYMQAAHGLDDIADLAHID